ncbi:MAG: hypothetical protein IPH69_11265, partial [Bacteroidales bacterium]|nr:hypothetical protein [Bacteroidales bacterium]
MSKDLTLAGGSFDVTTNTLNVAGNMTGAGALTFTTGTLNIGGNNTSTGVFTPGTGTVNYNGVAQVLRGTTYNNLTLSGSGNKTLQAGNLIVNGDLTITGSILYFDNAVLRNATVAGNLSGTGAIDMTGGSFVHTLRLNGANNAISNFTCGSGYVYYSGAVAQQIFAGTYNNLVTETSSQIRTIQGDITVNNLLTLTLGTLDFGNTVARNITVSGNLSGAGAINMSGAGLAHVLTLNGTNNAIGAFNTTAGSGSTVNYTRAGDQQVFVSVNYQDVNIGGSGIKTLGAGDITFNGNLDVTDATLRFDGGAARIISVSGNLSGTGIVDMSLNSRTHTLNLGGATNNFAGTLTTAAVASTINYNRAGDQTVFGSPNYRNITIPGGGNKSLQ